MPVDTERRLNLEPRGPAASVVDDALAFGRYARRLRSFVREPPLTAAEARRRIRAGLAAREERFLTVLDLAVFRNPRSPYRLLLEAAGAELGDIAALVREHALEGALARLHDAGVYVTLDEFKGRKPLERRGVFVSGDHHAYDNPLLTSPFEGASGGSKGFRRRLTFDLDLLDYEAACHLLFLEAFGLRSRPYAIWRAHPPNPSGMTNALRHVRCGLPVAAWFTPYKAPPGPEALKFALFTRVTVHVGRVYGARLQLPRHCSPDDAVRVARWLGDRRAEGRPAFLDTQAGIGMRTCLAAKSDGLDVSGTFLRFGGEPFTAEKAAVVEAVGCRAVCHYAMGETGRIAAACGDGVSFDDMHFLADKLAVLQREKVLDATGATVGAFHYTTLLPSSPKVMINVESDDYGELEERPCGCPFGEVGLVHHMRGIRSYEKLTSEGNHFLGSDLVALIDRVLPSRFGGEPGDYQLVEEEVGGLPKVSVVARPRLGELKEREVVDAVLEHLRTERRNRLMADFWRDGQTVRLVRREPYVTAAGKILPLHSVTAR